MRTIRAGALLLAGLAVGTAVPTAGAAQDDAEAVMVAAARWAQQRLPSGSLRIDPHRSGRAAEAAVLRVANALGADVGTLEATRRCTDVMNPSTCSLDSVVLLAFAAPEIRGDEARVRVYAWYRQDSAREPVARESWDVVLRRSGGGWEVAGPSRR